MTGPSPARRRRIASIALVASLALNGFMAGVLATGALRGPPHRDAVPRIFAFELRELAEHLPREDIHRIAERLRPLEPELRAQLDALRAKREEVNRLAAAPEPDRAAIDAALAESRREAEAMRAVVHRATYDAVLALSPEARARLAEPPKRP